MNLFKSAAEKKADRERTQKMRDTLDAVREARRQHNNYEVTHEQKLGKRKEPTTRWG